MSPLPPLVPETAPFAPEQRIWLNGYVAGLFAAQTLRREAASALPGAAPAAEAVPLVILYGSQTGTAEGLARKIAAAAKARGYAPRVVDAAAHASVDWAAERRLLVVTSTYGDGEMPDNAQGFWEWLQGEAAAPALSRLRFAVLALGDSAYPEFCAAGRKIDERLAALGAERLAPRTECDLDYEAPAQAWTEAVLGALAGTAGPGEAPAPAAVEAEPSPVPAAPASASPFGKANPFPARLVENRLLSGAGSGKEVRHFEIAIEGSGLAYESGDALGVWPTNDPGEVERFLAVLGHTGAEVIPGDLPWREALLSRFDLSRPTPELLRQAAARNGALALLLEPGRQENLQAWLSGRDVVDILLASPGFRPAPAPLSAWLRKLAPRLYSIASSPRAHPGRVHLTVGIVRYEAHGRQRQGVCSTFLADRAQASAAPVPVFVQPSPGFRLPADGGVPIVMVGPGTGIAPFRGFLHERRAAGAAGKNWLFFGDRHEASDFAYREELETMRREGHLTRLSTAFSRDGAGRVYVQDRMREEAAELWAWLRDGAHFYVCGDASRMARDVDAALHEVAETAGGLSKERAADYVKQLKAQKRYQRDVY